MIKIGDKKWTSADDSSKTNMCDEWLEDAKQARNRREFEWYMNYMFLDGNHYIKYNTVTNALERPPRRKGEVRVAVNKIRAANRAIKNYSTRFEPKWEPVPGDIDPETVKSARRAGKLLDYLYRKLHLEIMIKGLVDTGLNTSVGWVELDWDENAMNGQGEVKVVLHDPFDIYHDKGGYLYEGKFQGRFICKTVQKSLAEVQADERYDKKARKKVQSDDELATSIMKSRLIRKRQGPTEKKIKTVTVNEFYLYEDEENEEGGNIRLFTYAGGEVLRDEPLKDKEFPLYLFQIPQDPLNVYHRSWNADAIPLNKALDRTISQKIMYVNQALVYRIIAEKGHGANPITNDMGQILEINPGRKYNPMEMPPLPAALDSLNADMNLYIEDILSAHEACVSDDSEILTRRGWKTRKNLKVGDFVLTMNPDTKLSEWQPVLDIHEYEKDNEELVEIDNNNISALVTPNHRWFVRRTKVAGDNPWEFASEFKTTDELLGDDSIPLSAKHSQFPENNVYSDDFVELAGWVVTDGTYSNRVRITQKKEPQVTQIKRLLSRMNVTSQSKGVKQKDGCYQFYVDEKYGGKLKKILPDKIPTVDFIYSLTEDQLQILFETMLLGDGCYDGLHATFYNTDKRMVDAFQLICTLLGKPSRLSVDDRDSRPKELYEISVKDENHFTTIGNTKERRKKTIGKKKYTGVVWCPETPNGTWFMRRKGRVCFTGNSVGRMPTGARSGKTLEALQAAESNNLAGIRQSLESFLSILGKRILEIVADKYVASRVIKITEPESATEEGGESANYLKVIGGNAPNKPEDATIVTGDNEIIVKIGSWLGYTREAQRETLMKLGELGVVPADEILRQFEFPNIEELSARAKSERLEEHEMQAEIAGRKGQQGGQAAPGGAQDEMVRLADEENTKMANGEPLPPTEGATLAHTQAHMDFMRSRTFQEIPPESQQIIAQHARGELQEHGVGG